MPRIIVVGDLMVDAYYRSIASDRAEAGSPIYSVDPLEYRLGGAAAVAAMAVALGAEVTLLGVVGHDSDGWARLPGLLKSKGIADHLTHAIDRPTTRKERHLDADGRQILRLDVESSAEIPPDTRDVITRQFVDAILGADAVLLSDYGKGVLSQAMLQFIISTCRYHGVPVLVDPARGGDYERYRHCDWLLPNRVEATTASELPITSYHDAIQVGRFMGSWLSLGVGVLLKLDRDGAVLVPRGAGALILASKARDVRDATAAGDAVLAAVGVAVAEGNDPFTAAARGIAAGGLQCERFGATPITRAELNADMEAR